MTIAAPTWSINGRRLAVSLLYDGSEQQPGSALAIYDTVGRDIPSVIWAGPPGPAVQIAPGLPHYVNWSPDGEHLALLAVASTGMTLFVLDRRGHRPPVPITRGAPIFFAWSPSGDALLVHRAADLMLVRLAALDRPSILSRGGVACQLPAWASSGEIFAFGRRYRGGQSLSIMAGDGSERSVAAIHGDGCAVAWRPGRDDLAYSTHDPANPSANDGLWLVRARGGDPVRLISGQVGAFFWSPEGSRIAFLSPAPIPGQSCWCVLEIRTGTIRHYAPFFESPDLALRLTFFEQYGISHRIWSPDGSALLVLGRVPANGTPPDVAGNSIYVQAMQREAHPVFAAAGSFASWRLV